MIWLRICFISILRVYNNNNFYFPAWPEDLKEQKSDNIKYNHDKIFKIVFTGNVGEAQNFDQVIKAAIILKNYTDNLNLIEFASLFI